MQKPIIHLGERRPVVVVPPVVVTGIKPSPYYDKLRQRPGLLRAYSLRSPKAILDVTKYSTNDVWSYDPVTDTAKLFKPPRREFNLYPALAQYGIAGDEGVHSRYHLRVPLGVTAGSSLITWDVRWDESFQLNRGAVNSWKAYLMYGGTGTGGSNLLWCGHERLTGSSSVSFTPLDIGRHHD